MNILDRIAKDAIERANGRITTYSNRWVFVEQVKPDNEVFFPNGEDQDKRAMACIRGRASLCPNPMWQDKYPRTDSGYFVPFHVCQKCEHYRKRRKRAWYPHCAYMATSMKSAAKEVSGILNDAAKTTSDILGGGDLG